MSANLPRRSSQEADRTAPAASSKHIVHVAARYPPALGGLEMVVQALARYQHQMGIPVKVITSDQGAREGDIAGEGFRVTRLRSTEVAHTSIIPGLLPMLCRLECNALIHLHISAAYTPEMVWLTKLITRVPYIAHIHLDVHPSGRAGLLLEPYKKLLLRRVLLGAAAMLVPTADYRTLVSTKYDIPADRIQVVRNGTDHAIRDTSRLAPRSTDDVRLLFVGRLSPQKNIPLMLEAIAQYRSRYGSRIRLVIVGDGEGREEICSHIHRLGLGESVTLRGALRGEELESVYENSDLLLLTSKNESFGLVLIEAMTKALPIVSVDISAVRNVVANGINGLLTPAEPEALADAVNRLLTDTELYRAISANNLRSARSYNWSSVVADLAEIYSSL